MLSWRSQCLTRIWESCQGTASERSYFYWELNQNIWGKSLYSYPNTSQHLSASLHLQLMVNTCCQKPTLYSVSAVPASQKVNRMCEFERGSPSVNSMCESNEWRSKELCRSFKIGASYENHGPGSHHLDTDVYSRALLWKPVTLIMV